MHLRQSQKEQFKKLAEATGDLIGNKIAVKITKISKTSQQNNWDIVQNEHNKEILKESYISPKEIQKIIDDLRLM